MMEKDFNEKELDQLIQDWTDELLLQDIDDQITDSLIDFIDNDEAEIDVQELLDSHIHHLATEEKMAKCRQWRRVFSAVAAAAAVLLFGAIIFLTTREHSTPTENILALENQQKDNPTAIDNELPMVKADSSLMTTTKSVIKENSKVASRSMVKRHHRVTSKAPKKDDTEVSLIETFAEINSGVENLVDNTRECITMTNENLNVMEMNLINALYEIRNANIELNFDNKTTEI